MSFETIKFRFTVQKEKLSVINLKREKQDMPMLDRYINLIYAYKPYGSESYTLNSSDPVSGHFSQTVVNTYIANQTKLGYWLKLLKTYDTTPVVNINANNSADVICIALKKILKIRGYKDTQINLISFVGMYKTYRDYLNNSKTKLTDGTLVPDNTKLGFWGSDRSLKFGRIVFDALKIDIDDIFGSLLSPTGGIIGPGTSEWLLLLNDSFILLHSIFHDASGYLLKSFGLGNGYCYLDPNASNILKRSPLAGQVTGLAKCKLIIIQTTKQPSPFRSILNKPTINFRTVLPELRILSNCIYSEHNVATTPPRFTSFTSFTMNKNALRCFIGITATTLPGSATPYYNIYITFDGIATVLDQSTYNGFNELTEGDAGNTYINKDYFYIYKMLRTEFISKFTALLIDHSTSRSVLISNIKHIFIGGHKLGGVIASICSFDVPYLLPDIYQVNLVTSTITTVTQIHLCLFDTPRVGDPEYVDKLYNNVNNVWRFNYITDKTNQIGDSTYLHPPDLFINITNNSGGFTQGSGDIRPSTSIFNTIGNFVSNADLKAYQAAFKIRDSESFKVHRKFK